MLYDYAAISWGVPELVSMLAVIALFFWGKKLPGLSLSMAESIRELRRPPSQNNNIRRSK